MKIAKVSNPTEFRASELLVKVSNFLAEHNVKSYVVGGFVRDVLLRRDAADIDIAVASDALEIAPKIATVLGGKYVLLDKANKIGRVILINEQGHQELDFSTLENDIERDLAQRDFTIDAMAIDLKQLEGDFTDIQQPIDPFNGWDDLQRGVIRAVAKTTFEEDALRLLRAVRLAAELGFNIEQETKTLIQHYAPLIANVAGERVREELLRLLAISSDEKLLPYLDELGLLTAIIPELA
jgi:poly(A) polymerase